MVRLPLPELVAGMLGDIYRGSHSRQVEPSTNLSYFLYADCKKPGQGSMRKEALEETVGFAFPSILDCFIALPKWRVDLGPWLPIRSGMGDFETCLMVAWDSFQPCEASIRTQNCGRIEAQCREVGGDPPGSQGWLSTNIMVDISSPGCLHFIFFPNSLFLLKYLSILWSFSPSELTSLAISYLFIFFFISLRLWMALVLSLTEEGLFPWISIEKCIDNALYPAPKFLHWTG